MKKYLALLLMMALAAAPVALAEDAATPLPCGATFETGSVKPELRVDICSKCHPFFTGKQKLVDTGGRVDRFKKRYGID